MIRRLLALVPLALVAATTAPPSPLAPVDAGTVTLATDAETRWVPFDLTPGNQISFTLLLDGKPVTALLDTGVSYSVLARRSAAVDPARIRPGPAATAIGGAVTLGWQATRSVAFGGLTRIGGEIAVTDLPSLATGGARPVDVLIGRDLVGAEALDIDYASRRFRVLPSGRLPFTGVSAPLTVSPDRRVYESGIALGGHPIAPMVVDTGDGSAVTVSASAWAAAAPAGVGLTTAISYGLAGPAVSEVAIVSSLSVGEVAARDVEVRIEPQGGFSQSIGAAGRIGSGLLQRYRVLLDPGAGRMVLAPGPLADVPPPRSTSGLLLGIAADRLRVLHVMRGGPAAQAGWQAGEQICRVDGQAVDRGYAQSPLATWPIGEPGRTVALDLCDGTRRSLTLRRFY